MHTRSTPGRDRRARAARALVAAALAGVALAASAPAGAHAETRPEPGAVRLGLVGSSVGARFASPDLLALAPLPDRPVAGEPEGAAAPPGLGLGLRRADTARADTARADSAAPAPGTNGWRIAAVAGATGAATLGVLEFHRREWWADRNPRFRIINDWEYARWADKAGHLYASLVFTRFYAGALAWSGVPPRQAPLWGAGAAWTSMLYFEVLDGFGPQWGFSPGDLAFNTLGVAYATAQHYVPALDAIDFKLGYWPTGREGKVPAADYEGQTVWLTANPHRLIPASRGTFPRWLNVAVGYGARQSAPREGDAYHLDQSALYVGLDLDPTGLGLRGPFWDRVIPVLRLIHLPAPAIRLSPGVRPVLFAL